AFVSPRRRAALPFAQRPALRREGGRMASSAAAPAAEHGSTRLSLLAREARYRTGHARARALSRARNADECRHRPMAARAWPVVARDRAILAGRARQRAGRRA